MFNKAQQSKMNKNQPVDNKDNNPFSQSLINSKIIAFNVIPNVNADGGNPPYNNHLNNHMDEYRKETSVPLLNRHGAKVLNDDVHNAEKNIKTNDFDTENNDNQINNDIRFDAIDKNNIATEPNQFFGATRKDGSTIMDGEDSNAVADEGYGHPELYQIEKDDINADYMGDINQEDNIDENDLPTGEDLKDMESAYNNKDTKHDINYVITNKTKPIVNNEEMINDAQSGSPVLVGREMTNQTVGLSVMGANNKQTRDKINKTLGKYAPKYQKAYQSQIEPYAKRVQSQSRGQAHGFNPSQIRKSSNNKTVSHKSFGSNSINNKRIIKHDRNHGIQR